jgi:CheY-like chemotaxis protein
MPQSEIAKSTPYLRKMAFADNPEHLSLAIAACDNITRLAVVARLSIRRNDSRDRLDMPLNGKRILVVEDEALLAMDLEQMLTDLGCEVVINRGGVKGALRRVQEARFDAAVLDLNLGGERADPIADALAAHRIPFVFATGYDGDRLAPQHAKRPCLVKPYRNEDLANALLSALAP